MPSAEITSPMYRRKPLTRILRRSPVVVRLILWLGVLLIIAVMVAWRNLTYEKLQIDVARQRSFLIQSDQEIRHLDALIESAAPYREVADWADEHRGWKPIAGRVDTLFLPLSEFAPAQGGRP
ncbi:hypothetical protein IT157_06000 [bacterium]|nr:hypothetical protein [bacterium]